MDRGILDALKKFLLDPTGGVWGSESLRKWDS